MTDQEHLSRGPTEGTRAIMRRLDSVRDFEWDRGMYYPRRWDPSFGEFMTFEELFHYPIVHFRHHQRQLSARAHARKV